MIDILYILGSGSKHDDMELRLSLRCLEKNCNGIGRLFIVGNKPDWVQNVVHIPAEDTWTAENNAFQKILKACQTDISKEFLLMNDDFFMLKPSSIPMQYYGYFVRGFLKHKKEDNPYNRSINKTLEVLNHFGFTTPLNFEVHCPIRIQKNKFLLLNCVAEHFKKESTGVLCRSLYANLFKCQDVFSGYKVKDTKIYNDEFQEAGPTRCISTSDDCTNILKKIEELYPNKSRWEK